MPTAKTPPKTPPWIEIKVSRIPGAGTGAFARMDLPAGKLLGEYTGKILTPEQFEQAEDRRYVWELSEGDGPVSYLDGRPRRNGNWTRYVNCARTRAEENVDPVQKGRRMFYYAKRRIARGEELLVWYGSEYAKWLMGKSLLE